MSDLVAYTPLVYSAGGTKIKAGVQTLDTALAGADLRGRLWRSYVDTLYSTGQLDTWVGFDRPVSEVTP